MQNVRLCWQFVDILWLFIFPMPHLAGGKMFDGWLARAITVRLLLMALSLPSTVVAEGSNHAPYAIVAILVIAVAKGDLVIMHHMEAGRAELYWKWVYRGWLGLVTLLLIAGHVLTD
jgi:heme/copper-type cytochrome/quinol oxidase subunit 3